MKIGIIASPLIASENLQGSVMGMDAAGMNQATYFMRDKIYSNKIGAVVREYACNAIDEHNKYNVQKAVEIGIRKDANDVVFYVRDFAKGLSEHHVRNVFGMYFRSTKSGTNDVIGGFGIGSKAGHCYNDSFFVTSFFNKKRTTYACMLGGGETGVPVGHIYSIGESDTNESGLEITIPINLKSNSDLNKFDEEISKFVAHSPANILFTRLNKTEVIPNKLVLSKKFPEFELRLVEDSAYYARNTAVLQMGGVNYSKLIFDTIGYNVKKNHSLLIDLPIGSMSIPISRESFEDTVSNNKIISKIQEILSALMAKDLEKFKKKTAIELLEEHHSTVANSEYCGDIFSTSKSRLFSDVWPLVMHCRKSNGQIPVEKNNNKLIIAIIPNNYAQKYWIDKLKDYSVANNKNYYFISELHYQSISIDLSNDFHVISCRQLNYPKTKRDSKRYAISSNNGDQGSFSPLELHNYVRNNLKMPIAADEKEAQAQNKAFFKSAKNKDEIRHFVIADKRSTAKHRNIGYYSNSYKFVVNMLNLGWLEFNSTEHKQILMEIIKIEQEKAEKSNAAANCKRRWLELSPRTRHLIEKKHDNAVRVIKFWHAIRKENTLRSKMIASLDNAGYNSPVYTRQQFRQILKLK